MKHLGNWEDGPGGILSDFKGQQPSPKWGRVSTARVLTTSLWTEAANTAKKDKFKTWAYPFYSFPNVSLNSGSSASDLVRLDTYRSVQLRQSFILLLTPGHCSYGLASPPAQ